MEESPVKLYFKGSYVTFRNMEQIKNPYAVFIKINLEEIYRICKPAMFSYAK